MKKHIYTLLLFLLSINVNYAHEPLYGLGPETLPRHLSGIELGTHFQSTEIEYELGYSFGITRNWTVRLDIPAIDNSISFGLGGIRFRTKYALRRKFSPGVMKRLTAIVAIKLPTESKKIGGSDITAFTFGLANGYESRRWYYFSDIGYSYYQSSTNLTPGGKLKYNLVGGIRPVKTGYLKPDLVFLIELNGVLSFKNSINGVDVLQSGGNTLALAPGFLLSYRNLMLKAGMQFGLSNTSYTNKPESNGIISFEYHF